MHRTLPCWALLPLLLTVTACDDNLSQPATYEAYQAEPPAPLACIPNLDGRIDAAEMAPTFDIAASYIVTPPLPVDAQSGYPVSVEGVVNDGVRSWDWSADDPNLMVATLTAYPLGEQWYASHFPGAQFATPNDLAGRLDGIYSHDDTALRLHGFASVEEHPAEGQTLMVYETPVELFRFPLEVGQSWTQTGVVLNGTLQGLHPWSQDDVYQVRVESAGQLFLPDFTFTQALRVTTRAEIRPKAGTREGYVQHQSSFVFECFGEVARATSLLATGDEEDPGPGFLEAREIRKLGWF